MKGKLKKISLLTVAAMSALGISTYVKAEKECTEHTNYYFFLQKQRNIEENLFPSKDTPDSKGHAVYPALPEGATIKSEERICIKKGEQKDGVCSEYWNASDYYDRLKDLIAQPKQNLKISATETADFGVKKVDTNVTYYTKEMDDYSTVRTDDLVASTYIPDLVNITRENQDYSMRFTVNRTLKRTNFDGLPGFDFDWGDKISNTFVHPAVYMIKYEMCTGEDEPKEYDVTINYYYYKDNNPTTEQISPSYTDKVQDGKTVTVDSPEIPGCSIVRDNGKTYDTDKVVTIKVNGSNVERNVYYYCPTENKGEQLPTGDSLIYIAWAIGFGSLAYAVYYFAKGGKLKKEEV